MHKQRRLGNFSYNIARPHLCPVGHRGLELPFLLAVEAGHCASPAHELSFGLDERVQRPLDTVVNALDQSGPELDAQGRFGIDHRLARPHPRRLLIDLDRGVIAPQFNDLAYQVQLTYANDIVHPGACHAVCNHDRTCNLDYLALFRFAHYQNLFFFIATKALSPPGLRG